MGPAATGDTQKPIDQIPDSALEKLRISAEKYGADDAVVIDAQGVILDPRVRLKCMIPRCFMSGGCGHCPPNGYGLDTVKDVVERHSRAVFFRVKVPSNIIAAEGLDRTLESGILDPDGAMLNLGGYYMLVSTIVKLIQKQAFETGYLSQAGFAAGNCRSTFCRLQPTCQLMTHGVCRHETLSSPSMESCGMDVFTMGARAGWNVYPIGGSCIPEKVPNGTLMGLVLLRALNEGESVEPEQAWQNLLMESQPKRPLGGPQARSFKSRVKKMKNNLSALQETNTTIGQFRHMADEWPKWQQLNENLKILEGSWQGVVNLYVQSMAGRPKKKH